MSNRQRLRRRIAESQNWRCCYCGVRMTADYSRDTSFSLDEIVPQSKGGRANYGNSVGACLLCNARRGDMNALCFWVIVQAFGRLNGWPMATPESAARHYEHQFRLFGHNPDFVAESPP